MHVIVCAQGVLPYSSSRRRRNFGFRRHSVTSLVGSTNQLIVDLNNYDPNPIPTLTLKLWLT